MTDEQGVNKEEHEAEGAAVVFEPFEVSTSEGGGYPSNEAWSALNTRQTLIDIPMSIRVVSRDVYDDLAQTRGTPDALHYVVSGVILVVQCEA